MVVVIMIALLATMMVPRMWDTQSRRFSLAVEQVADLLIAYAQRDSLGSTRVGITYDAGRHEILLVNYEATDEDGRTGEWFRDTLNRPVKLPEFIRPGENVWATENGEYYDFSIWPLSAQPNAQRPDIAITLIWETREAVIELPGHAVGPRIRDSGGPSFGGAPDRQAVDLDMQGRDREDW